MATKQQLYANLTGSTRHEQKIIDSCESLNELKQELVYIVDKFECIRSQRHKETQYYQGERYNYGQANIDSALNSAHSIARKLNYVIYSPNGAWFIKTI